MLVLFYLSTTLIANVIGQRACEDFSADPANCTTFIRCFYNLRIKFTCPPGTAWESSLKTCVWKEYVESCGSNKRAQERSIADSSDVITYEADPSTLNNMLIGRTLSDSKSLGPIVTPRSYQCSYCATGNCQVVVNVIQCYCGPSQCAPAPTTPPQPRNPCAPNPCLNGGQCISQGAGFICRCPSTFTGNLCEAPAPTPCQPNPCFNGGTCIPQGSSFICQCPTNFIGVCCETRLTTTTPYNPCAQNPCQNGAQCIPSGMTFLCQCPQGFYGSRCEARNYCMPNPCANNGLCTQTPTGYICSCSFPYTGTNCQQIITTTTTTTTTRTTSLATRAPAPCGPSCSCVVYPCPVVVVTNPCVPNPCNNMGGCAVQNNAAMCYCSNAYYGYYCQLRRSGRSLAGQTCNRTCLNGGQCYVDDNGRSQCSCSNDFYGERCESRNGPKSCAAKNPCMNNGRCVTTSTGAQCVCQKGSSGILCEKIARSAKYCSLECQAGGTCVYVRATAQCRCPKNRTGRLCEKSSA